MQFKHPELLYALFLLFIPIFIHLFQLRKFQKVAFTNVAFLKKVTIETRKSSQLKKWLTLLMRMLALACLILAFAQPFKASKSALNKDKETVIYIDNSFSMQLKGADGALLQKGLQKLYAYDINEKQISWFTNDFSKKGATSQDFKNDLLAIDYTQKQLTIKEVLLKSNQLFSKNNTTSEKKLVYISDFQKNEEFPEVETDLIVDLVPLRSKEITNISIDTAFISKKGISTISLNVQLTAQGNVPKTIPVSLFNNNQLIAKTAVDFSEKTESIQTKSVVFEINNKDQFIGKIEVVDPNLIFDNTLFFSINTPEKIKVLDINNQNSSYLNRIYNLNEFDFTQQDTNSLNYSDFSSQNFIILNELDIIPESLINALKSFSDEGGSILIIPSSKINIDNYNSIFSKLKLGSISELINQEKKITKIEFEHPLFKNVFEKKVVNFQFPKVNSFYNVNTLSPALLKFEDSKPFIIKNEGVYAFTASISQENSNFQNSPLIVPTLYNMAKQSLPLPKLYYEIGKQNQYSIPISIEKNEILEINNGTSSFIPLQQTKANQVTITTFENPKSSGVFTINKNNIPVGNVSYNYARNESKLVYANPENWNNTTIYESIDELFKSIEQNNTIHSYWKWFVIFALLFLVFEMIILKFYK